MENEELQELDLSFGSSDTTCMDFIDNFELKEILDDKTE